MLVIGVIGPIASGKSVVLDELRRLGAASIEADAVSREVLQPGSELLSQVIEEFGERFLRRDGSLDRRALGAEIMEDDQARRRLERIVHPAMVARMAARVEEVRRDGRVPAVAIEAANLVEMGALPLADATVLVTASREERVRRLMARDGLSRERAESMVRLHERLGIESHAADYCIHTDADEAQTRRRVQRLWRDIVKRCG